MSVFRAGTNKSSTNVFPSVRPTLDLDFANSKTLDPRITFTRASGGSYVGADGLIKYAGVNEARFDHDPETGESLGLLVEESRSNLFDYSQTFDGIWSEKDLSFGSTILSPAGDNTAIKLVENDQSSTHYTARIITYLNGNTYTFSVFVKAAERYYITLRALTQATFPGEADFDLLNETVNAVNGSATIEKYPNGWYRCSVTATATNNGTTGTGIYMNEILGIVNYKGNGTSGIYIWGAQLEQGAFPTSYIPTQGSTRTRQPDFASITGKNFSDFYRQDEGTVFVKFNLNTNGSTARIFNIDDGTSANRISGLCGNTVYQTFIAPENRGPAINFPSTFKFKLSSAHKDYATVNYLNNIYSNLVSGQNIIIPKNLNTFRIGNWHNNNFQGTTISCLTYFPKRLPNEQLIALTR